MRGFNSPGFNSRTMWLSATSMGAIVGGADLCASEGSTLRVAGVDAILRYFIETLRAVFAGVVEHPMILENSKRSPVYALCFAVGNPKGAPTAVRIAGYLTRN